MIYEQNYVPDVVFTPTLYFFYLLQKKKKIMKIRNLRDDWLSRSAPAVLLFELVSGQRGKKIQASNGFYCYLANFRLSRRCPFTWHHTELLYTNSFLLLSYEVCA